MIKLSIDPEVNLKSQFREANVEWRHIFSGRAGDGVKTVFPYSPWTPAMTLNLIRKKMIKLKQQMLKSDPNDEEVKNFEIPDPVPFDFTPAMAKRHYR